MAGVVDRDPDWFEKLKVNGRIDWRKVMASKEYQQDLADLRVLADTAIRAGVGSISAA